MDFIMNGQASGSVAAALLACNMDTRILQPYIGEDGRTYVTQNNGFDKDGKPVLVAVPTNNANATLRKDDWIHLDTAILAAARPRLMAVADLRSRGLVYNMPNGMAHTVLQYERVTDTTPAIVSMDASRESENARPEFDLSNLPLPIISKDFSFDLRQIQASRMGGSPLDLTMAEQSARQVAETAEKLLLGTYGSYKFGGGTVYGYVNFPQRLTKTLTNPQAPGWIPAVTLREVMEMKQQSKDAFYYGPWVLYHSSDFDTVMDGDFSSAKGDITLRDRVLKVQGITDVKSLDFLPARTMVLVEMTSGVIREVVGMDIQTIQWETKGGLRQHFKVMAIMVPQIRADINGNTGLVHGTAPAL